VQDSLLIAEQNLPFDEKLIMSLCGNGFGKGQIVRSFQKMNASVLLRLPNGIQIHGE
jgi:hypothetical protein